MADALLQAPLWRSSQAAGRVTPMLRRDRALLLTGWAAAPLTPSRSSSNATPPAVLGVDPGLYSGHSLRAGFATELRAHHVPAHLIMRHTGRTDPRMLATYDRATDLFNEPALAGEWW